jgi:ankyrin repeat protein
MAEPTTKHPIDPEACDKLFRMIDRSIRQTFTSHALMKSLKEEIEYQKSCDDISVDRILQFFHHFCQTQIGKALHDSRNEWRLSEAEVHQRLMLNKLLYEAAVNGQSEEVAKYVAQGADVNYTKKKGDTILMDAARKGHTCIVKILLANGADVEKKDEHGITALLLATLHGRKDIVQLLLDNKADVNSYANLTGSALEAASRLNMKEIVELLLERGAVVDEDALKVAKDDSYFSVLWLLEQAKETQLNRKF